MVGMKLEPSKQEFASVHVNGIAAADEYTSTRDLAFYSSVNDSISAFARFGLEAPRCKFFD